EELAGMMIGEKVSLSYEYIKVPLSEKPLLSIKNLSFVNKSGAKRLDRLTFDLYGGEMLGIAGIVGSGQKELCEVLTGISAASGSAIFEGSELLKMNPLEIRRLGIRMNFVPEDRLGMGLVAGMDVTDNILLRSYDSSKGIFIDKKSGGKHAEDIVKRYGIATPSIHNAVKQLSGGNIQKILLAREIEMHPKFLIVSYPFRGLDIGATNTIIATLNKQKKHGIAILLIAEDIDQICAICDRVMVLHDGKNMGIIDPKSTSKETIGLMMMGKYTSDGVSK
ncbi:ATP-binding cassette domain-containing protein, partial [Treponema porcinum]|uniref:ATP-binding cassette domain-containing protein n=1 Tax=Treponema porcinum TaxID=261392 RepID=UPI002355B817